jgi:hypothetical protein
MELDDIKPGMEIFFTSQVVDVADTYRNRVLRVIYVDKECRFREEAVRIQGRNMDFQVFMPSHLYEYLRKVQECGKVCTLCYDIFCENRQT